jgi:predicted HicB family RNase H-like nuclease
MTKRVLDFAKGDEEAKHYSARMPTVLWERARRYAFEHEISFNELLKTSLEQYLDQSDHPQAKDERIP